MEINYYWAKNCNYSLFKGIVSKKIARQATLAFICLPGISAHHKDVWPTLLQIAILLDKIENSIALFFYTNTTSLNP